mmetsp:Transcript_50977/g.129478  ORF Transcript_50977/g.129478 Transcript_50977/m.129478 type:complete len:353 (-) Transcript_50977:75-1133(-)
MASTPFSVKLLWLRWTSSISWQYLKMSLKSAPASSPSWLLKSLRIFSSGHFLQRFTTSCMPALVKAFRERSTSVYLLVESSPNSRSTTRFRSPSPRFFLERFNLSPPTPLPPLPPPPLPPPPRRRSPTLRLLLRPRPSRSSLRRLLLEGLPSSSALPFLAALSTPVLGPGFPATIGFSSTMARTSVSEVCFTSSAEGLRSRFGRLAEGSASLSATFDSACSGFAQVVLPPSFSSSLPVSLSFSSAATEASLPTSEAFTSSLGSSALAGSSFLASSTSCDASCFASSPGFSSDVPGLSSLSALASTASTAFSSAFTSSAFSSLLAVSAFSSVFSSVFSSFSSFSSFTSSFAAG